jgi:ABC-type transport system involved in multi-copper enzyme maturation permease subunit
MVTQKRDHATRLRELYAEERVEKKDPMPRILARTTTVGVEAVMRPLVWATGPVFEKELRVAARRRRNFVLRTAYLLVLVLFVLLAWSSHGGRLSPSLLAQGRSMAPEVARTIVTQVLTFQFILLPLLAAVMLGGSMSEEIRNRTLGVLMVTPVGSVRIVLGKLFSRLLQLGLLLAVSLPLLVAIRVMGGIDMEMVLLGLAVTATMCLFIGALGLLLSTFFQTAVTVVIILLCLLGGLYVLQGSMIEPGYWPFPDTVGYVLFYLQMLDPYSVFRNVISGAHRTGGTASVYTSPWLIAAGHCAAMIFFTGCVLLWAAQRVRKVGMKMVTGDTRTATRWEGLMRPQAAVRGATGALRPVTGSPVLWRERQVRFGPSRLASIVIWSVIAGGAAALDIGACWGFRYHELVLVGFIGNNLFLFCAGVLLTVLMTSPGLSAEKEGRTLGLLLTTPLSEAGILWDKALGAFLRTLPVWGLLAVHLAAYVVVGAVHPRIIPYTLVLSVSVIVMFTGSGLYFATITRRTSAAVGLNLVWALVVLVGPVFLMDWLPPTWWEFPAGLLVRLGHPVYDVFDLSVWSLYPLANRLPAFYTSPTAMGWDWTGSSHVPMVMVSTVAVVWIVAGLCFGRRAARRLRRGVV